jgi:hypothetical protein
VDLESYRRLNSLVQRYGGVLADELGLDLIAVQAFFCLFERSVFGQDHTHSSYDLYKSLRAYASSKLQLSKKQKAVTPKNVTEALANLESLRLVSSTGQSRTNRRSVDLRGGRPPSRLFQANPTADIITTLEALIEDKRRSLVGVFTELADLQEQKSIQTLEKRESSK